MDFDHLVFEKVCFNLIKRNLFCFIYFFFLLLFFISFRFFVSFVFTGVGTIPPKKIVPPPRLGSVFGLALELGLELGDNCRRTVFTGGKKENFLHANEMLSFIHLLYVQSCTFL